MKNSESGLGTVMGETQFSPVKGDVEGNFYAPNIHEAAEKAIISGAGVVAQGAGAVTAGERGVAVKILGNVSGPVVGGNVVTDAGEFVGRDHVIITYDTAFERVIGSTAFVTNQLELSYAQMREQAQGWFRFSLIAAAVGFVLIGVGVIAVMFGQVTAGLITTISSIIPNAAAALFFVQSKNANERVDVIQTRLIEAREIQTAVEIVNTIDDGKYRDRLKAEIVRKALRLEKESHKSEE